MARATKRAAQPSRWTTLRERVTIAMLMRGAFLVMAIAACLFSAVAALQVWTEGAADPISKALLSAAAIIAEVIVIAGLPVIVAAWAAGDKPRAFVASVLFVIALPMSFSTALAYQAQIQRHAETRAEEGSRARAAAETDARATRHALAQFDSDAAALAAQYRQDLARTPATAVSARARLIESISAANAAAVEGRRPLEQALREAEARVAALPLAMTGETSRARELAAILGVTPEQAERGFHIVVAILLELSKTFGAFLAANPTAAGFRRPRASNDTPTTTTKTAPATTTLPVPVRRDEAAPVLSIRERMAARSATRG